MPDLDGFSAQAQSWLEANAPDAVRGLSISVEGDANWGGKRATYNPPEMKIWLDVMAAKGWTAPTWPAEYGGGGLSPEEAKRLAREIATLKLPAPLIGFGLEAGEIRLPFGETAITLFTTTALPVFIGMFVRARWPGVAGDWHRPLLYSSFAALMLMVLSLGVSLMGEDLTSLLMGGSLPVALLIAVMMSLGLAASRAVGLAPAQRRTVAIELGLQNFTLALVLAFSILEEPRYLGPALLYLPTMFAAVGLLVAVARISDRGRSPPGPARSPQTRTPG